MLPCELLILLAKLYAATLLLGLIIIILAAVQLHKKWVYTKVLNILHPNNVIIGGIASILIVWFFDFGDLGVDDLILGLTGMAVAWTAWETAQSKQTANKNLKYERTPYLRLQKVDSDYILKTIIATTGKPPIIAQNLLHNYPNIQIVNDGRGLARKIKFIRFSTTDKVWSIAPIEVVGQNGSTFLKYNSQTRSQLLANDSLTIVIEYEDLAGSEYIAKFVSGASSDGFDIIYQQEVKK